MPLILIVNSQFILCTFDMCGFGKSISNLRTKKVGAYPLTIAPKSIILYISLKNMKEAFKQSSVKPSKLCVSFRIQQQQHLSSDRCFFVPCFCSPTSKELVRSQNIYQNSSYEGEYLNEKTLKKLKTFCPIALRTDRGWHWKI